MPSFKFHAIGAKQSERHQVYTIAARAKDILQFASIDRIGRTETGALKGFQRTQIASHIREIRSYLEQDDAVLPNPIVVAFTEGVRVEKTKTGYILEIDAGDPPRGLVVDGQQRLTALSELGEKDFEAFVSILVCADENELRRQFILINNTRPLPKSLIYELLPTVGALPERMDNRALAAAMTARLNYDPTSSLKGQIWQHTNPDGVIKDTAIQRVIMQSLTDGIMRDLVRSRSGEDACFAILNEFYLGVQTTFPEAWRGHTPKTSRLVHGAGIASLGFVMEVLALLDGARTSEQFAKGLSCLRDQTAWTSGEWRFGPNDIRPWKGIQNVNRDVVLLAQYMIGIVRDDIRRRKGSLAPTPLFPEERPTSGAEAA